MFILALEREVVIIHLLLILLRIFPCNRRLSCCYCDANICLAAIKQTKACEESNYRIWNPNFGSPSVCQFKIMQSKICFGNATLCTPSERARFRFLNSIGELLKRGKQFALATIESAEASNATRVANYFGQRTQCKF